MRLSAEEAWRRYADRVYAAAYSVCGNRADADDAVQDTFVRYETRPQEYRDEQHLKAWLLRVAINRSRDMMTSFWRRNRRSWDECVDDLAFEQPEELHLFETVMRLPDKYRTVLHLFYYEQMSVRDIARLLRRRDGTVKSQLNRARQLLKAQLMEEWDDDE